MAADTSEGTFRVRFTTEVRQAPSRTSAVLRSLQSGVLVKPAAAAIENGGVRRVPLLPRGWIDAEALEPIGANSVSEKAVPFAGLSRASPSISSSSKSTTASSSEGPPSPIEAVSAPVVATPEKTESWLDRLGDGRRLGAATARSAAADQGARGINGSSHGVGTATVAKDTMPAPRKAAAPVQARCATPGCPYLAHLEPEFAGFCCRACARGAAYHGHRCQKVQALLNGYPDPTNCTAATSSSQEESGTRGRTAASKLEPQTVALKDSDRSSRECDHVETGMVDDTNPATQLNAAAPEFKPSTFNPAAVDFKPAASQPGTYRIWRDTEVRSGPSISSALLRTLQAGATVKQLGPTLRVAGGVVRMPLHPRGWIDATALDGWHDDVGTGTAPKDVTAPLGGTGSFDGWYGHDGTTSANLVQDIESYLNAGNDSSEQIDAANRIKTRISEVFASIGAIGDVKLFGSFTTGFRTSNSDLDIAYATPIASEHQLPLLAKFASALPDFGFNNVTRIFQSSTPLVKFTDTESGLEIDFCVSNELGVRNSSLLSSYCQYDERVVQLGRLVKDWAKRHCLVGTADGCLNSYAYILMVIHYLQSLRPPVLPNLQSLVEESVPIVDTKWGCADKWETKFLEDVSTLPPSQNTQNIGDLLKGFFKYYCETFNWRLFAVCIRLNQPGIAIDKYSLALPTMGDQWYLEDPFDLKHNLARNCSKAGRACIMEEMWKALRVLEHAGSWRQICPEGAPALYYLKCRITQTVTSTSLLNHFDGCGMSKLHYPGIDNAARTGQVFLEFSSSAARRLAHAKNETYVGECQLYLHYSSERALAEARSEGKYEEYSV